MRGIMHGVSRHGIVTVVCTMISRNLCQNINVLSLGHGDTVTKIIYKLKEQHTTTTDMFKILKILQNLSFEVMKTLNTAYTSTQNHKT